MLPKTSKSEEVIGRYKKALSYIESFSNISVEKGKEGSPDIFIKRTRYFLERLGDPQKGIKFIHVTGTAGKGTTSAFIHEMLVRDGKRVGLFTSPYATAAIEMIKVGGLYISPADFADIADIVRSGVEDSSNPYGKPTASELFFIIALMYFKRERCGWAVVEAGIGGRFDATNAIESPLATIITNIDYDHTKILGPKISDIASDKAGIIKKGSLFFTSESKTGPLSIFKKACDREGAKFHAVKVSGDPQESGRELATAVCRGIGISSKSVSLVKQVELPCRFEKVSLKPTIILDGAHNRIKMKSVARNLKSMKYERLHLVLGMGAISADSRRMLPEIVPLADSVTLAGSGDLKRKLSNPKAIELLTKGFLKKGVEARIALDPHEALNKALDGAHDRDCILVTGSFSIAGELRKEWFSEDWILEHRKSFK
jgi:dihydrofolate synthase / folylpolyglutamate synthase